MLTLIKTEIKKILKNKTSRLCFILLALIMVGVGIIEYQDVSAYRSNEAYRQEVMDWQEREETLVKFAKESLEDPWYDDLQKEQISRRISIAEYRLENNIPKDIYKNVWWFFNDKAFNVVSTIAILMLVIIGSTNIAGEYNLKTIRQVLLLPYKRWKILISKILAVSLVGLMLYGVVFVMGLMSGILIHGTSGINSDIVLYFGENITVMNMSIYSLIVALLKLVEILFYAALLTLVCVLTKNTSASILISGGLAVFAVPICNFLVSYYPIINYLPFLNLDFRKYLDFGTTMPVIEALFGSFVVKGITPLISMVIVLLTIAIFVLISVNKFSRDDV